jgi:hypothetical protein
MPTPAYETDYKPARVAANVNDDMEKGTPTDAIAYQKRGCHRSCVWAVMRPLLFAVLSLFLTFCVGLAVLFLIIVVVRVQDPLCGKANF